MPNFNFPITYIPGVLRFCKSLGWFIEYYVPVPNQNKLQRVRYRLNFIRNRYVTLNDFKKDANRRLNLLNLKLAGGWSPLLENDNSRYYTPLNEVIDRYLEEKSKELRPDTLRSYNSICKKIKLWSDENTKGIYCSMFNRLCAIRFLDDINHSINTRTWNNNLKAASAFFSWAAEKCYTKNNPFINIKKKREGDKKRILIPKNYRDKIDQWCDEYNPAFKIVCRLIFISLIRPKEIVNLKIKDLFLEEHYIYVTSQNAKNHNCRIATITPDIEDFFYSLHLDRFDRECYLFGLGYLPNKQPIGGARFRKDWDKLRKDLKLPEEMQLYSLRDTGINNLLKIGVDPLTVMQHADHHNLSMTTRYANHVDPNLINKIRESGLKF